MEARTTFSRHTAGCLSFILAVVLFAALDASERSLVTQASPRAPVENRSQTPQDRLTILESEIRLLRQQQKLLREEISMIRQLVERGNVADERRRQTPAGCDELRKRVQALIERIDKLLAATKPK